LNKGKELERACDFAMALKYYFAGRMYFAAKKLRQAHALPLVHDAARTPSATPKKGAPNHTPGPIAGGGVPAAPAPTNSPASVRAPFGATVPLGPFHASPASALSADLDAKQQKLLDDFDQLYRDLLPMTNAEVKNTLLSIYCTYSCVLHLFCFFVISCHRPMPVRVSASTIKMWYSGEEP
jgi:hypothetical protein